ncbi:unnamed protein product [Amoebophrya sp. A120]|nr:unnamed protein product [Amoebophrya sp. A120]|eukprot:GSA120T00018591001.1
MVWPGKPVLNRVPRPSDVVPVEAFTADDSAEARLFRFKNALYDFILSIIDETESVAIPLRIGQGSCAGGQKEYCAVIAKAIDVAFRNNVDVSIYEKPCAL